MRQKVSSPLPITSVSSGPPQGRASPDTRPTAPRAARISRSCFVIAKGFHPPSVGGGNHRPGLFPHPPPPTPHLLDAAGLGHSEFFLLLGSLHRDFDDPRLGSSETLGGGLRGAVGPRGPLRALRHGGWDLTRSNCTAPGESSAPQPRSQSGAH